MARADVHRASPDAGSTWAAAAPLSAAALLLAVPLTPDDRSRAVLVALTMLALTAAVRRTGDEGATGAVVVADLVVGLGLLGALTGLMALSTWPVTVLAALALAWTARHRIPGRAGASAWLRWGRVDAPLLLLLVVALVGASLALVAWTAVAEPDAPPFVTQLDGRPWAVVLLGLLSFSLVNAVAEEFLFRGVLLTALAGVLPAAAAVAVQAVAFGAAHWSGFPSGWTGVALSCGYGAVLGVLRLGSRGIALPVAAHVCADLTIGVLGLALLADA